MQKVLAIQDISCVGRCSLTNIIPILSALRIQCCPLPTAVYSTHTYGYGVPERRDLTESLPDFIGHWRREKVGFDAIYSGFLGSAAQIDHVKSAISAFPCPTVLVDPVMGDEGKVYSTYTPEMCSRMRELTEYATILTPNVTEAAILLGKDHTQRGPSQDELLRWAEELSEGGKRHVVITGAHTSVGRVSCVFKTDNNSGGETGVYSSVLHGGYYPGTGDIFASVLLGRLMGDLSLADAVKNAADFTGMCVKLALDSKTPPRDGVPFEELLDRLILPPATTE